MIMSDKFKYELEQNFNYTEAKNMIELFDVIPLNMKESYRSTIDTSNIKYMEYRRHASLLAKLNQRDKTQRLNLEDLKSATGTTDLQEFKKQFAKKWGVYINALQETKLVVEDLSDLIMDSTTTPFNEGVRQRLITSRNHIKYIWKHNEELTPTFLQCVLVLNALCDSYGIEEDTGLETMIVEMLEYEKSDYMGTGIKAWKVFKSVVGVASSAKNLDIEGIVDNSIDVYENIKG